MEWNSQIVMLSLQDTIIILPLYLTIYIYIYYRCLDLTHVGPKSKSQKKLNASWQKKQIVMWVPAKNDVGPTNNKQNKSNVG